MANNKFKFYAGTTSSNTILKDLAKVLSISVRDKDNEIIQERNWDIVYPFVNKTPVEKDYVAPIDKNNLTAAEFAYKIENQVRQITDRVVLKTTTTPVEVDEEEQDVLGIESDLNTKSIDMYIELYKPTYLADPEEFEPETEKIGVLPKLKVYDQTKNDPDDMESTPFVRKLIRNNHYIYIRAFDALGNDGKSPQEEIKDDFTGNILETQSHVSEWAKLSWYRDFEEAQVDETDADIGGDTIADGIEFIPTITAGINGDTRIRFWINTNNDRVSMVIMGNPSLEFSSNKHLTSFCYLGRIKSFENSINDTAGNFVLATSSSTLPCKTTQKVNSTTNMDANSMALEESLFVGTGDGNKTRFFIPFANAYDEGTLQVVVLNLKDETKPEEGYETSFTALNPVFYRVDADLLEFKNFVPKTAARIYVKANFIVPSVSTTKGVTRDEFGNIVSIIYPNKYGENTATCVTDLAMYATRSKAYWQKHLLMFNVTEEYMTKEMYGKSAYTGEYYADRIKVTHGNDGPRGMLDASLVIDQSSLIPLDDLVVNRDFSKKPTEPEETYIYFPITAPYSPLASSPNALSGIAILKEIVYPEPESDAVAVERVVDDLYIGNVRAVVTNLELPLTGEYSTTISWVSSDETHIDVTTTPGIAAVTRPAETEDMVTVTLTATVTLNAESQTIDFVCNVYPEGLSDAQSVQVDADSLDLASENGLVDLTGVTLNLSLPTEGDNETTITWTSDDPTVVEVVNSL